MPIPPRFTAVPLTRPSVKRPSAAQVVPAFEGMATRQLVCSQRLFRGGNAAWDRWLQRDRDIAAPGGIMGLSQLLEFKSWNGLEELGEYGRVISHSPVSCFLSMACGELIVSKSSTTPGYLVWLGGTAVPLPTVFINLFFFRHNN